MIDEQDQDWAAPDVQEVDANASLLRSPGTGLQLADGGGRRVLPSA